MKRILSTVASIAVLSGSFAHAAPPQKSAPQVASPNAAPQKPLMGEPGKVLFEDDFVSGDLKKWKVGKGFFAVEDSVVRVTENPADHHGAYFKAPFKFTSIVSEFSFKFDGSKTFNYTMDDLSYKGSHAGHICRVTIAPTQVSLGDSKNGVMKNEVYEKNQDPKTTPEEKKKLRDEIKDFSSSYKASLDPAAWHRALVEISGDEMLISIDGVPAGYLKAPGIAHENKQLLGFTCAGKSTLIDNVKVWEAKPNPAWETARESVLANLKKNAPKP